MKSVVISSERPRSWLSICVPPHDSDGLVVSFLPWVELVTESIKKQPLRLERSGR